MVEAPVILVIFFIFPDLYLSFYVSCIRLPDTFCIGYNSIRRNMVEIIHSGVIFFMSNSKESPK